jgi:hypothetical protein
MHLISWIHHCGSEQLRTRLVKGMGLSYTDQSFILGVEFKNGNTLYTHCLLFIFTKQAVKVPRKS